jgi:CHAD domain-containing protein
MEALQRLAREVDRLSLALEPVRGVIALRETGEWRQELEVSTREPAVDASRPTIVVGSPPRPDARPEPSELTHSPLADAVHPDAGDPRLAEAADAPHASVPIQAPPATSPVPLALAQVAHLRAQLEPRIAALRGHAGWEQAEDPTEALRQLRVATRRLRAFMRLFAPMLGKKRSERLVRQLRSITRGIGPLREWAVSIEALRSEHATAEPLLRAALEHMIAWAEERRSRALRRARKALCHVDILALSDGLDAELDRACGRMLRLDEQLAAEAWTLVQPEIERAFDGMPQPEHEDEIEALHAVRTRAKQVRYVLELLQPTLGQAYGTLRRPAKTIQRALGEHHDWAVLAELLRERREELTAVGLRTLAGALDLLLITVQQRRAAAFDAAKPTLMGFGKARYEGSATRR